MSINVIINPGSGPVENACEERAIDNIKHFITDCNIKDLNWIRIPEFDYNKQDGDGRFAFLIWKNGFCHEIQMPGIPLEQVRYMFSDQNIWDYPRLYVDNSSWVWKYALLDETDFQSQDEGGE